MSNIPPARTALSVALVSLGLAFGASAQTGTTGSGTVAGTTGATSKSTAGATSNPSANTSAQGSTSSHGGTLSHGDRKFVEEAAIGGMAEVQYGQLAESKAASDEVRKFGQRMVTDHGKANDQLKQVASSKGITLPGDLDSKHKREYDKLSKLSGADFDREYMKLMVSDHKKDVKDFQSTAKSAKDAEVKTFAANTLPVLQEHLQMAQSTDDAVRSASRGGGMTKSGSSGSGRTSSNSTSTTSGAMGSSTSGPAGGKASGAGTATAQSGGATPGK